MNTRLPLVALAAATLALTACGSGTSSSDSDSGRWDEDDAAYKLAQIDAHARDDVISPRDRGIQDYDDALADADELCDEERDRIGDITAASMSMLDEYTPGHDETLLSLLQALPDAVTDAPEDCSVTMGEMVVVLTS